MFDWIKIETDEQIKELCALAKEIWHEYSICFISEDQIDYMLEKFQSESVVKDRLNFKNTNTTFFKKMMKTQAILESNVKKITFFFLKSISKKVSEAKATAEKQQ